MKKISKIFVPTDFSHNSINAFRYAIWMADRCNAEIVLCHIVSPEIVTADMPMVSSELTQQRVEGGKEMLKSIVETTLLQQDIGTELDKIPLISTLVEIGSPGSYISDKAQKVNADLIIMGTRDDHNSIDRIFGSVTTATIEKSKISVLIVPEDSDIRTISNAAFATEISDSNPFHIWETIQLLSVFNPSIKVINVKEDSTEGGLTLADFEEYYKENAVLPTISFHELVKDDSIADVIEDFVDNTRIDLLIMYKPHRGFFERIFHRSLTKEISREIEIPFLVLK